MHGLATACGVWVHWITWKVLSWLTFSQFPFSSVNYISQESTIENGSVLKLWTVNGRFIGDVSCEHMINCLEFSSAPEGISVNVIATGLSNGLIR